MFIKGNFKILNGSLKYLKFSLGNAKREYFLNIHGQSKVCFGQDLKNTLQPDFLLIDRIPHSTLNLSLSFF